MQSSRTKNNKKHFENILCFGCLSADRKLYKLLQLKDVFKQICKNIVRGGVNAEILLCFECMALIRNVKRFQDKVRTSQNTLQRYKQYGFEKKISINLSCLCTATAYVLDFNKNIEYEEEVDSKSNLNLDNIKIEDGYYNLADDLYDFDDGDDEAIGGDAQDIPNEEIDKTPLVTMTESNLNHDLIKDENILPTLEYNHAPIVSHTKEDEEEPIMKIEVEKKKTPRSLSFPLPPEKKKVNKENIIKSSKHRLKKINFNKNLYKIIGLNNSNGNVYEKIKIPYEEINYWLEKERKNIFFKSINTIYKCEKCAIKIARKKSQQHISRHSQNLQYICDYCTLSFRKKVRLMNHVKLHRYIRSCNFCEYKCVSEFLMYKHVEREHEISRAVQCVQCKANFKRKRDFFQHYRDDHYELNNTFICDYCNKKCRTRRMIEKHIFNNHTPHTCTQCSLTFTEPWRLTHHYALKHSVSRTEAAYCVKCDRQFDNVPQFRYHLNASVAHREERKPHKLSKSKQPVQCLACPRVYSKRYTMMNHYNKVHVGKSRYQCHHCNKLFVNNTKLKDHIRYHHEGHVRERKHVCTVCGRGFTQKTVLQNHIRTHTGERPFECPHCDSKFAQKTPLVMHIKKIHNTI